MLHVPTSKPPPAGTEPAPIAAPTDIDKPAGANNRLWPAGRVRIRVTFAEVDSETARATGEDPDSHAFVFTTTLLRAAQAELLAALATSVHSDFINETVVVPGTGDNGSGPKFRLELCSGM